MTSTQQQPTATAPLSPLSSASSKSTDSAVFRFGVIADVQYADVADGTNWSGSEQRRYRNSLKIFQQAVHHWNEEHQKEPLAFVAQLGDLVDAKAKTHLDKAMGDLQQVVSGSAIPRWAHLIGNHELYSLTRKQIADIFPTMDGVGVVGANGHTYYSFIPAKGWRVVILDTFHFSVLGYPKDDPTYLAALEVLRQKNPNDVTSDTDWTAGLQGMQQRWVPYNGGLGETQRAWLEGELGQAQAEGERVIVCSHIPLHPGACTPSSILWDYEEVLDIFRRHPKVVVAAFAGHDHAGGFFHDADLGAHFITCPSPMVCRGDIVAFGVVAVYNHSIHISGQGDLGSREMDFILDD